MQQVTRAVVEAWRSDWDGEELLTVTEVDDNNKASILQLCGDVARHWWRLPGRSANVEDETGSFSRADKHANVHGVGQGQSLLWRDGNGYMSIARIFVAKSGRCVAQLARVSQVRTWTGAVEERPKIIASSTVAARVGPAVVRPRAAHFNTKTCQLQDVGVQLLLLLLLLTWDDPLAVDDYVLHTADKERKALSEDAEEGSRTTQHRHTKARFS